jgi:hypothetical protein
MPTYLEWNRALIAHFTPNVPRHSPVRLSVDDEALFEIFATQFNRPDATLQDASKDFLSAVRTECVVGQSVKLPRIAFTEDGEPTWVAFLAAMVDAAFHMIDDDDAAGHNYFSRLRTALGLDPAGDNRSNRPDGMKILPFDDQAPEAPLWQRWNTWLSDRGWIPTATLRQTERRHWSDYPISQTLLRDGDRQKIAGMLEEERASGRLPVSPDLERIAAFLRRSVARMPKHLQSLIRRENRMDLGRFEEMAQEVLELAMGQGGFPAGAAAKAPSAFQAATRLLAGLYRHEDKARGILEYRLFPRQPLRYQGEQVYVRWEGECRPLQPYPPRWFRWLGPLPLHEPPPVEIVGHPRLKQLILPANTFWVFVRQSGDAGPWASWRRAELGERFLLLCRPCHDDHLRTLREGKLLAWDDVREVVPFGVTWREYLGCRVLASNWNEVNESPESSELFAALRPSGRASIHLVGGLPAPDGGGWMEGAPPSVWVCAFQDRLELCLSSLVDLDCETVWSDFDANAPSSPLPLPSELPAGPYLLSAKAGSRLLAERVLEIRPWEDLAARPPAEPESVLIPGYRLCGAALEPVEP